LVVNVVVRKQISFTCKTNKKFIQTIVKEVQQRHAAKSSIDSLTAYEGGATRSVKQERRELIPKSVMDALGRRLALGAAKHGINNWRKGGEEFRLATVNHMLDHIFEYLENGGSENTDAIVCNAAFLCEYEVREPYKGIVLK